MWAHSKHWRCWRKDLVNVRVQNHEVTLEHISTRTKLASDQEEVKPPQTEEVRRAVATRASATTGQQQS